MNAVLQILISSALAGITAFFGFLFLVPTKIGNRTIGLWFDRKLEAYKAEQNEKLAKLQGDIDHLTDRGRLSNEREYIATAKAWESYVDAHYATLQCVASFLSYPDLDRMSDDDLDHFLRSTNFTDRQIGDVKRAQDKNALFSRIAHFHLINKADQALHDAREFILKQSVFIEQGLESLLNQNIDRLTHAWAEERTNFGRRGAEIYEARQTLLGNGTAWLNELRARVRDRLLRNLTP